MNAHLRVSEFQPPSVVNHLPVVGVIPINVDQYVIMCYDGRKASYVVWSLGYNGRVWVAENGHYDISSRRRAVDKMAERAGFRRVS